VLKNQDFQKLTAPNFLGGVGYVKIEKMVFFRGAEVEVKQVFFRELSSF